MRAPSHVIPSSGMMRVEYPRFLLDALSLKQLLLALLEDEDDDDEEDSSPIRPLHSVALPSISLSDRNPLIQCSLSCPAVEECKLNYNTVTTPTMFCTPVARQMT